MSSPAMKLVKDGLFASPSRPKFTRGRSLIVSAPSWDPRMFSTKEQSRRRSLIVSAPPWALRMVSPLEQCRGRSLIVSAPPWTQRMVFPQEQSRGRSLIVSAPPWAQRMVSPQEQSRGRSLIVSAPPWDPMVSPQGQSRGRSLLVCVRPWIPDRTVLRPRPHRPFPVPVNTEGGLEAHWKNNRYHWLLSSHPKRVNLSVWDACEIKGSLPHSGIKKMSQKKIWI